MQPNWGSLQELPAIADELTITLEDDSTQTKMFKLKITGAFRDDSVAAPNQVADPEFELGEIVYGGAGSVTRTQIMSQNLQYTAPTLFDSIEETVDQGQAILIAEGHHSWSNEMTFEMDVYFEDATFTYADEYNYYDYWVGPYGRYNIIDPAE